MVVGDARPVGMKREGWTWYSVIPTEIDEEFV